MRRTEQLCEDCIRTPQQHFRAAEIAHPLQGQRQIVERRGGLDGVVPVALLEDRKCLSKLGLCITVLALAQQRGPQDGAARGGVAMARAEDPFGLLEKLPAEPLCGGIIALAKFRLSFIGKPLPAPVVDLPHRRALRRRGLLLRFSLLGMAFRRSKAE